MKKFLVSLSLVLCTNVVTTFSCSNQSLLLSEKNIASELLREDVPSDIHALEAMVSDQSEAELVEFENMVRSM